MPLSMPCLLEVGRPTARARAWHAACPRRFWRNNIVGGERVRCSCPAHDADDLPEVKP